ncbi:MAG TPA: hypothetical protein VMW52_09395 [Phycisphaerae bacterium]|nr:hypothetical protein [Phycisphaerae bacterium]
MTDDAYQLSESAARRIAAAVRTIEDRPAGPEGPHSTRRPIPYRRRWYRVVSNEGLGAYTARLQRWDEKASPPALIDCDDEADPEYGLDQDAWEAHGSVTLATGDKVAGWHLSADGEQILLIDRGTRPAGAAQYKILQTHGTGADAREVWDWARLHDDT